MSRLHTAASTRCSLTLARTNNNMKSNRPTPSEKSNPQITIKAAARGSMPERHGEGAIDAADVDDEMVTSFLQYCAMCEKQIIVPNSKILYCSESCRRRDATTSSPDSYITLGLQSRTSPTQSVNAFLDHAIPVADALPRHHSLPGTCMPDSRIPPVQHEGGSDLDPTEWKPAEPAGSDKSADAAEERSLASGRSTPSLATSWKPKLPHRPSSEAFTYLASFHRSTDSMGSVQRRAARRAARTTPSLSHSPTLSSVGSDDSLGTPYEFISRPSAVSLPTTAVTKPTSVSAKLGEGLSMTYEKKDVREPSTIQISAASGSLKKLLGAKGTESEGKM